jgi:hypothetical protein
MAAIDELIKKHNLKKENPVVNRIITNFSQPSIQQWLIKLYIVGEIMDTHNVSWYESALREIKPLMKFLPKPIETFKSTYEFETQITTLLQYKEYRKFRDMCPADTKKMLDEHFLDKTENPRQQNIKGFRFHGINRTKISQFILNLSVKSQKLFIRRISKFKNVRDLLIELETYTLYALNNSDFDTILTKIKRTKNAHLRYANEKDNIIICRVTSPKAIRTLASASGWCLKDSCYFPNYVKTPAHIQYIVFDYNCRPNSREHCFATTYVMNNFSNAHFFDNQCFRASNYIKIHPKLKLEMFTGFDKIAFEENKIDKNILAKSKNVDIKTVIENINYDASRVTEYIGYIADDTKKMEEFIYSFFDTNTKTYRLKMINSTLLKYFSYKFVDLKEETLDLLAKNGLKVKNSINATYLLTVLNFSTVDDQKRVNILTKFFDEKRSSIVTNPLLLFAYQNGMTKTFEFLMSEIIRHRKRFTNVKKYAESYSKEMTLHNLNVKKNKKKS